VTEGGDATPAEPDRPRVWVHFSCAKPVLPERGPIPDRRFGELRELAGRPDDFCSTSWDSTGPLASVDLMWKVPSVREAEVLAT
jgi:hypothetical protein